MILCLDLGTKTGWALSGPPISSGVEDFSSQRRYEGAGMRFLRFKTWLTDLKAASGDRLDAVYFEEVRRHKGVSAAHIYGGLMAHLTAWCEHHQIPYAGVPVGNIKRFAAGKGNASKDEVIAAVQKHGHAPKDDNEADAIALLLFAQAGESKAAA